ncbi:MAG: DUF411 domain-containing protein [Cellvibrionaceae bacterium]
MKPIAILVLLLSCLHWVSVSHAESTENQRSTNLDVYKSPTCGCCEDWVNHMKSDGFSVKIYHPENLDAIKELFAISPAYQACHTSVTAGYFFEGHIPASIVEHFLAQRPKDVAGLAVPGMPLGSPGMDVTGYYRAYELIQINKDGSRSPYARVSHDRIVYAGESL